MQVYQDQASFTADLHAILLSTFIKNRLSLTLAKVLTDQPLNPLDWTSPLMKAIISHLTFIDQDDYLLYI
jgi:hypothetical protein